MKSVVLSVALLATIMASDSYAQGLDNWGTPQECQLATNFRFYRPAVVRQQPLGQYEEIRPHPTGACIDMEVPDRIGGRRWVRVEQGRPFVYDTRTNGIVRLAECNNNVYGEAPFVDEALAPSLRQNVAVNASLNDQLLRELRDLLARQQTDLDRLRASSSQQTRTEIDVDVDDDGLPGWAKAVIIGGTIAGGGYILYRCVRTNGWCRGYEKITQITNVGPGGVTISTTR